MNVSRIPDGELLLIRETLTSLNNVIDAQSITVTPVMGASIAVQVRACGPKRWQR